MPTWTVTILNADGSTHATANATLNSNPGLGQSSTIPSQKYSCNHNHTLTGNKCRVNAMGGLGVNPQYDPIDPDEGPREPDPTGPSWEATPTDPGPHK